MVRETSFDPQIALPPGLELSAIRRAIEYVEKECSELVDVYYEQANVFSALVGIMGTRALHDLSSYEKHRNVDTAQQRFPDLKRRGSGQCPGPRHCLESKASKRPWAIQSHHDHPGWSVVWLPDRLHEGLQPETTVVIWRVDMVFLEKKDWKYEGSRASAAGGGRTHAFGVKKAAQGLRGCAVYQREGIVIRGGKAIPADLPRSS